MYRVTGEVGGKHAISTMQGNSSITYTNTAKCLSKKSFPSKMGLGMGKKKHCCVNIVLSATKSNVITVFVMTFFLVRSVTSNRS